MLPGGTGYLRDPDKLAGEPPDWQAAELLDAVDPPATYDNRGLVTILHQGQAPKCVGAATAGSIAARLRAMGVVVPAESMPSPTWIWTLARMRNDALNQYSGTFIRDGFGAIAKHGFVSVEHWPDDEALIKGKPRWRRIPSMNAFRMAFDQAKLSGYYRIDSLGERRILDFKRAISQDRFPVFGTLVGEGIGRVRDWTPLDPPSLNEELGGHAMFGCGYDEEGAYVANSWGKRYGVDGFLRMSWRYIAWAMTWDIWCADLIPNYSEVAA